MYILNKRNAVWRCCRYQRWPELISGSSEKPLCKVISLHVVYQRTPHLRWLLVVVDLQTSTMAPELLPNYGPFDLRSATVLITGGSSGIGRGLAEEFLKAGSTVIITGRRESALKETQAAHPGLHIYVNDASKAEEREKLAQWVVKEFPKLNVLVNNAGIMRSGPLSKEDDWSVRQSEIAINVEAPVQLMQLLSPHFLKQTEAAFINMSSGLGHVPCGPAPGTITSCQP